ncbi:MAG: thioredoxin domain-containing protein [Minisyncoccia bacterium]
MTEENNSSSVRVASPAKNSLGIPVAIVLAAALIAGAIVFTGSQKSGTSLQVGTGTEKEQITEETEIAPVTDKDHIRGNPNAPIVIVEYSDFECPYCKNFHETMNKIMADYGKDGKVAWVYRQFPIVQLHPNAPKIAAASECVASLGKNDAFWKFADFVFGEREINSPTDITRLGEYAEKSGVDKAKFTACVDAGTFTSKITSDLGLAAKAGAKGTPYSILMVGNQQGIINGAQPYETVKQMVETMLSQVGS